MAGIDTSIYGQQLPPQGFNTPFQVLGQLGALQQQRQQIASNAALEEERRQKIADDARKQKDADTFNAIIGNPNLTPDAFLEKVRTTAPEHFETAQKMVNEAKKNAADLAEKAANTARANAELQTHQQTYAANLGRLLEAGGNTPTAFELLAKMHQDAFPDSKQPDQWRDFVRQHGPDSIPQIAKMMQAQSPAVQKQAAEQKGQESESEQKARILAGTSPTGITAEQQQQNAAKQTELAQGAQRVGLETRRVKVEEANAAEKNQPPDITSSINTTQSGNKYLDLSVFQTPKAREEARKAADTAGVIAVDKDTAAGLKAADTARSNFNSMLAQLKGKLPTDPTGRVITGPKNLLEKYFQTDADLAAFGSWRQAAIQGVQSLAEKGMGLRLNQTEINNMIDALPKLTDTWDTAQQKVKNFGTMLDNKEKTALNRDRSTASTMRREIPGHPGQFAVSTDGGKTWKAE